MSFDNSRFPFDPWKNFSGVVMEQGRVQLDADWNEWLAELSRRIQAGTLDIFGHAAYPATTPWAFLITATSGTPNTVTIGSGRMYVDGLLAENHGDPATASWDPALAELSGAPQPPNLASPNPNPLDFTKQPYLPDAILPTDTGSYLFYLDVWTRAITWVQEPHLIDVAVGVDTTGRLQTVWQVKFMPNTAGWTCATPDSTIWPTPNPGLLTTGIAPNPTAGPCCLTDGSGFTGVENQFYRVEIHQAGTGSATANTNPGTATFKWSRDNASVETGVTAITTVQNSVNQTASQLAVLSLGRDQVLGFHAGDWIELLDDWSELWSNSGVLCQIDSVNVSPPSITLTTTVNTTPAPPATGTPPSFPVDANFMTDPTRHTRVRRWDQSGTIFDVNGIKWCDVNLTGGEIPVPAPGTTLVLENGIAVSFDTDASNNPIGGNFNVADFWTFAARTADGSVETLTDAPPRGIHHHYTKLSTVTFSTPNASNPDCRTPWPTSGEGECGCCCSATVGDNVTSFGKYSSIQQAINSLPTSGPNIGGEVCILPGRYYEYISLVGLSDVVIHGCGAETRVASPTMKPGGAAGKPTTNADPASGLAAIVTIINSNNIELREFSVEAADEEVGILLDGMQLQNQQGVPANLANVPAQTTIGDFPSDVTISDLALTASTLPALASMSVDVLHCTNNRIAMEDVRSQWPAVYLCGTEMHFEKNWVGLEDASNATDWMPVNLVNDLSGNFAPSTSSAVANGGIQIAGSSTDVFIIENEIEGGAFNGITLGSFELLSNNQTSTGTVTGVLPGTPDPCSPGATLNLPSTVTTGTGVAKLVAGGPLQNILIARNRIRNMGLCGIGPVGFFNLKETIEVISIQNLTITGNTISGSLQNPVEALGQAAFFAAYGAVCVPDVQNLILRDNTITDFGNTPGAQVCGVYVLNGEQLEISRNQVLETRDWSAVPNQSIPFSSGAQAGIMVSLVTPPALDQVANASSWKSSFSEGTLSRPVYQPGLPALRVENNVVRVPLGPALEAIGWGPFAIVDNHLSTGGTVSTQSQAASGFFNKDEAEFTTVSDRIFSEFLTVVILNLGLAIEFDKPAKSFTEVYNNGIAFEASVGINPLAASSSGAVLFTNNICQLETRVSGVQGFASVVILTLDHLLFANNQCWMDGPLTALMNALLLGLTLQVNSNRFQEGLNTAFISGFTFGLSNVSTYNIATHCLYALGLQAYTINTPNVVLDTTLCPDQAKNR